ncbi:DUF2312 domain-containing protein [Agrobacterium sp. Ap1]|uniref:DUF2312 domain-containing protein n=1 Tax=Agrobacterium sp. Ap1 TaxID=2815337 RepID=UPI001A905A42|nr:DUF2312 domain-containing protein [Agrobacterium sp. Ap1]MBO0141475.1 DUF2312 domain-containing protein [Agrobacterium sp. Ap1]
MSADKQLKAYIDRVLRLKEEQDTIGDDIREVYAEAKAEGYDKTIMGKLVAHLRKVQKSGEDAVSEQEMNFDTYLQAYHRASGTAVATHTHEEEFDPITGEFVSDEPVHQSPRKAAEVVSERTATNQPETANETPKQVYGDSVAAATALPSQSVDIPAAGDQGQEIDGSNDRCPGELYSPEKALTSDDDAIAAVKGKARLANVTDVEPSSSAPIAPASQGEAEAPSAESVSPEIHGSFDANTGGEDVTAPNAAHQHQAGSGLVSEPRPAKHPALLLRPHRQHPGEEICGGSGKNHCRACAAAMREEEVA